ncbi:MAG: hypothetical protein QOD33_1048 [Pyrinomonadaceae bacterium]|jgi:hypothetical protein|nr:hypothetical protein [Pyrinomonadaceae bacterium]
MADKKTFAVPDTNGEPPLFLGLMWAATRAENFDDPEKGEGRPLYSAYIFPYSPSSEEKAKAKTDQEELPLFVSYIFPFVRPNDVVLGGGGGGSHAALGGAGGEAMFLGKVFSFTPAEPAPPATPPAEPVA